MFSLNYTSYQISSINTFYLDIKSVDIRRLPENVRDRNLSRSCLVTTKMANATVNEEGRYGCKVPQSKCGLNLSKVFMLLCQHTERGHILTAMSAAPRFYVTFFTIVFNIYDFVLSLY